MYRSLKNGQVDKQTLTDNTLEAKKIDLSKLDNKRILFSLRITYRESSYYK